MNPSSTYRLQIRPGFDLDAAAAIVPYLRDLGVGWVYLSPLLTATTGSDHGYDVVDPARIDPARGGAEGFARFIAAAREAGLGVLVDIVPNHMGVAVPRENPWWWDVLRLGEASAHARAFDIDWAFGGGRVRLPVLGGELDDVIGDLVIDRDPAASAPDGVLRYVDHVFPLAPGSLDGIGSAPTTVDVRTVLGRQHYELRFWRDEATDLNYRRFFAVTSLAGVRVEDPAVFAAAHVEIVRWATEGLVDGLRVDHPDGLVDPAGYLERLRSAVGGLPVWVEKILEHAATDHPERLAPWWASAGTTGYDAMAELDRLFIDPNGVAALDGLDAALRAETGLPPAPAWDDLIVETKRTMATTILQSEVRRLVRTLPAEVRETVGADAAAPALAEILAAFPMYRSYLPAGAADLVRAGEEASARRPDLADGIDALLPVLGDATLEVARRFEQTTGPVMAKGVEDTAFYRFTRLGTLTEVGGDPSVASLDVEGFHAAFAERHARWPHALTALSTHDTKRSEDVRARLSVLSEQPERWASALRALRAVATTGHGPTDELLWQAIVGCWPASAERLHAYAEKAVREAGERTTWLAPDAAFEAAVHALVDAAFGAARPLVEDLVGHIAPAGWSNALGQKLLQLAGPGVPDVYQGSEVQELSLVDPDNRRPVDFTAHAALLHDIDAAVAATELDARLGAEGGPGMGEPLLPPVDASGRAKLLVTSRVLRLRRDRPELFTRYLPLEVVGEAAAHLVAFDRGGVIAAATRLPVGLGRRGGWGDTALLLPPGDWVDTLTGRVESGAVPIAQLCATYPVALLVRAG